MKMFFKKYSVNIQPNLSFEEYFIQNSSRKKSDLGWVISDGYYQELYLFDTTKNKPFELEESFIYLTDLVNKGENFDLFFTTKRGYFKMIVSKAGKLAALEICSVDQSFIEQFNIEKSLIPQDLSFYLECALRMCNEFEILGLKAEVIEE